MPLCRCCHGGTVAPGDLWHGVRNFGHGSSGRNVNGQSGGQKSRAIGRTARPSCGRIRRELSSSDPARRGSLGILSPRSIQQNAPRNDLSHHLFFHPAGRADRTCEDAQTTGCVPRCNLWMRRVVLLCSALPQPLQSPHPGAHNLRTANGPPAHGQTRSLCPLIAPSAGSLSKCSKLPLWCHTQDKEPSRQLYGENSLENARRDSQLGRSEFDNIERVCTARSMALDLSKPG